MCKYEFILVNHSGTLLYSSSLNGTYFDPTKSRINLFECYIGSSSWPNKPAPWINDDNGVEMRINFSAMIDEDVVGYPSIINFVTNPIIKKVC